MVQTQIKSFDDYLRIYDFSLKHNDKFWDSVAQSKIKWRKRWTQVSDCDFKNAKIRWYLDGKLNVAENCLDRHIEAGLGNKPALIWVGNDLDEERIITFQELYSEVRRMSCVLENLGIRKGDRIAIYLPNIPELVTSVLACARLGIIHSVIFGGFSAHSIQSRVQDCQAKLIITANGTFRGKKWIDLKANVDEAMNLGCPSIQNVLVINRHPDYAWDRKKYDLRFEELIQNATVESNSTPEHSSEDPLFILYTSGSTGKPKGVLHKMGGYLTYVAYTHEIVFQPQSDDIFWCTADLGWITGHSYVVYGPLANGTTTLMYEGIPTYPDPSRFWKIIEKYKVSIFYTSPTAIRILASFGSQFVENCNLRSLRTLGSVGEPINPEAWKWYSRAIGENRCPIVDTWWQTETGGILISPLAGITPTLPGSASLPLPGIEPKIVSDQGQEIKDTSQGNLVLCRSWPGQMTEVFGEPKRFYETYFTQFPGLYSAGDAAHQNTEGFYWITGRTDDVIKISGHRLGSAEVESACLVHPAISEAAAVGIPDPLTGEALAIFAVLKEGQKSSETIEKELTSTVRNEIGHVATPKALFWVPGLPKTRSGKVMRRILKKIAIHDTQKLGDISSLADPQIVEQILKSQNSRPARAPI